MKNTYFLVFLLFFLAGNAVAETRYVSDVLEITMRSGKGTSFGITRMLRSGTAVQVLEVDKKSGYTQVRTLLIQNGDLRPESGLEIREQVAQDRTPEPGRSIYEPDASQLDLWTAVRRPIHPGC